MTQKDLIKIVVSSLQDYYPMPIAKTENQFDNYYSEAIRRKLIGENEKNPEAIMTKQDIAKITCKSFELWRACRESQHVHSKLQRCFKHCTSLQGLCSNRSRAWYITYC